MTVLLIDDEELQLIRLEKGKKSSACGQRDSLLCQPCQGDGGSGKKAN
jgi:hypothetical protein